MILFFLSSPSNKQTNKQSNKQTKNIGICPCPPQGYHLTGPMSLDPRQRNGPWSANKRFDVATRWAPETIVITGPKVNG